MARDVFGQTFQNPILLASGTAGFGRELEGLIALDGLGGIVTKAVSLLPRAGNPAPRVAEFPGGMLNSVGLANPGLERVRREALPWLTARLVRARILVNVVGFTEAEYAEVVAGLEAVSGIAGYELNLSCPNTHAGGMEFGADPEAVRRVVGRCRAVTRRALIAKLAPAVPDLAVLAAAAVEAGADGISAINTLPGYLAGLGRPRLGQGNGGVSGPALLPIGVLAVRKIRERLPAIPIIGVGGVRSAGDVRQYLDAGAQLVAIGTAQLADPRLPERIIRELEAGARQAAHG
ncbi:MAG TPA: dihydroorotate dehydrogenase [Gemmatimonadales bacterium]|nr:dihydroorotate dehydrogenase [Gemmatimonadales bacterium]